jgi:hypothetical protein
MALTIDLDDQPVTEAGEIRRHPIYGKLTPELEAAGPFSKHLPQ